MILRFVKPFIILFVSSTLLSDLNPVEAKVFPVTDSPANRQALESSVAYLLSLTDEQVLDMVPVESGGVYFTSCPHCDYGAEEAGCFNSTWDPKKPKQLKCRGCG